MRDTPIFIVGVQRSGTTLLAAMLAAHSRLSCGPETHFFRRLAEVDVSRLCEPLTWPNPAADFVRSISHSGFVSGERTTLLAKYHLEPDSIDAFLKTRQPSVAATLASVTEQYMHARRKVRWVEKTPDHILHVEAIRRYFTGSPIIRIVRDPRDVALSLTKVPWGVASLVEGLLYWERVTRQSREFFARDSGVLTIRFEDLIGDPPATLRRICQFIGEPFEPGMLDTSSTGAEINSRGVPWKQKVAQVPDATRIAAWRTELTLRDNQLAEALLGDWMDAFGYPRGETFTAFGDIRPGLAAAGGHAEELGALAAEGVRFWPVSRTEPATWTIYLGESPSWPLLGDIVRARLSGRRVCWIADQAGTAWRGDRSSLLRRCLAPFRLSVEPVPNAVTRG